MESAVITFPIFGDGFMIDIPSYILIPGTEFKIYLYGLIITAGFLLAGLYLLKRRDTFGLTQDNILDLVIIAIPCGIVGARLYYVIFNFNDFFGDGKWLNIFRLREGGLAVYGGIILAVIVVIMYGRVKKISFAKLADAGGMGLLIGQAIGRWGNFFNREAFGDITEVPWKMGLTTQLGTTYVHPAFLYESLWCAAGFVLLHFFSKKFKKYNGQLFLLYVAWYGFGRYFIESIRADSLYLGGTYIRVSQVLAALSFIAAAVLLIRNHICGVRSADSPETEVSEEYPADGPDETITETIPEPADLEESAKESHAADKPYEPDGEKREEL